MGNKLVFVSGTPFWFTPEGRFEAAEQNNGLFVERVMLRTERGLREIGPRQSRSIERGTPGREAGRAGFELADEEDLTRWGGPLFLAGLAWWIEAGEAILLIEVPLPGGRSPPRY